MARTGLPDPQCGAPSLCFRFNPDSSGGGWGTGKDATLQVTVLNLTVSIQCPSNDRHHSRQALGIQRHTGHPMDYVLVTLYMGVRGGHRKLTTGRTPEGCLAPWGCWDRFLSTLPDSALDHDVSTVMKRGVSRGIWDQSPEKSPSTEWNLKLPFKLSWPTMTASSAC